MRRRNEVVAAVIMIFIVAAALFAYYNYGSGILEIKMSDPPSSWGEATQVYLNYSTIEVHKAQSDNESGWFTIVERSSWINLTRTLHVNETISYKNLHSGVYNLIRFRVLDSRITVGGRNYTATVSSGEFTTAITRGGVRVNTGHTAVLLIEINVKVEGYQFEGNFRLVPAVRVTPV